MSRADNNSLGGSAPSIYITKMDQRKDVQLKIVTSAFCYPNTLFADDFNAFIDERAKILSAEASKLMA